MEYWVRKAEKDLSNKTKVNNQNPKYQKPNIKQISMTQIQNSKRRIRQ
jgi:hypothetical protein